MSSPNTDLMKKLLEAFKGEAQEHLQGMSCALIELDKTPSRPKQASIMEAMLREAHSLKGSARLLNISNIETICQALETALRAAQRKEEILSPALIDTFHLTVDAISQIILSPHLGQEEEASIKDLANQLVSFSHPESKTDLYPTSINLATQGSTHSSNVSPVHDKQPKATPHSHLQTIRVPTDKLSHILYQAEDMLSLKLIANECLSSIREFNNLLKMWESKWSKVASDAHCLEQALKTPAANTTAVNTSLTAVLDFLDWSSTHIRSLESLASTLTTRAEHNCRFTSQSIDHLVSDTKNLLMFPFSSLSYLFPKLVHDLAREQGKDVQLSLHESDMEIDKRILDEMKAPLIHVLRNSIHHGIEKPDERVKKGKPPQGTVTVTVSPRENNLVEILINDDGAGIDISQVHRAASAQGSASPEELSKLSEQEAISLIFRSGVSTAPVVTEISGRGLGLAILQEKVEKLGGQIVVESTLYQGTLFRILLPTAITAFRGLLVEAARQCFIVPLSNVEKVARIKSQDISTVENKATICLDKHVISLVRLVDLLELTSEPYDQTSWMPVVVLGSGNKTIAISVDTILAEQEVIAKSFQKPLVRVRNIAGVGLLGSGKIYPILNVSDLIASAARITPSTIIVAHRAPALSPKRSILVAEDSITARILIKNILELAGYKVETAVDGIDAYTKLKTTNFDLVVSDIDMPRMNGFDLTAKIRGDKKLSDVPVILLTALASREDRERGIEVGANAYLIKSTFDQSNLLEIIQRLA